MRKNKFIDLELGTAIKRFGLYVAVFVIAFGLTSSIRNAGGTYAISTCPSGYSLSLDNSDYCCPSGYEYNYDGSDIDSSLSGKCYRQVDLQTSCNENENKTNAINLDNSYGVGYFCYADAEIATTPSSSCYVIIENGEYKKVFWGIAAPDETSGWRSVSGKTEETCKIHTVTFVPNGGTVSGNTENITKKVFVGDSVVMPTPEKKGYTFKYWRDSATEYQFNAEQSVEIGSDITLVAWYEPVETPEQPTEQTYTATFNANGEGATLNGNATMNCSTTTGSCKIESLPTATLAGKEFKGWGTSSTCTSGDTTSLTLTNSATYYACWATDSGSTGEDETKTYDVTFDVGSGNEFYIKGKKSDDDTITDVSEINFSEYTAEHQDGLDFLGWSETSDCDEAHDTKQFKVEEDTTLYACYADPPSDEPDGYEVTFDVGTDGTFYVNHTKKNNNVLTLSKLVYSTYTAKKDGYVFKGWGTSKNCEKGESRGTLTVEDDTTLYACFVEEADIEENPATGDFLLYLAFLIGILALGYTGYYAYKTVKSRE